MASRDPKDLDPDVERLYHRFRARMVAAGLPFRLTCTYRSQAEQDALYAQGRTTPGPIVTKTTRSKHTSRRAFDIVLLDPVGRPIWTPSAYVAAGKIGEELGLRWGGDWNGNGRSDDERFLDMPHFELPLTSAKA